MLYPIADIAFCIQSIIVIQILVLIVFVVELGKWPQSVIPDDKAMQRRRSSIAALATLFNAQSPVLEHIALCDRGGGCIIICIWISSGERKMLYEELITRH